MTTSPVLSMTTPLPSRSPPRIAAVRASSGTCASTATTALRISTRSGFAAAGRGDAPTSAHASTRVQISRTTEGRRAAAFAMMTLRGSKPSPDSLDSDRSGRPGVRWLRRSECVPSPAAPRDDGPSPSRQPTMYTTSRVGAERFCRSRQRVRDVLVFEGVISPARAVPARGTTGYSLARASSAAIAGSVFPSRNSRKAPPPVET